MKTNTSALAVIPPPGLQRYIVCSKDVAPEMMARINKALEATAPRGRSK